MPRGGSNNWGPSVRRGPYGGDNDRGCWLWTGRKVGRYGYGKVTVGGKAKRVHREAFRAVYGWDPPVVRTGATPQRVGDRIICSPARFRTTRTTR